MVEERAQRASRHHRRVVCVDFGSTFTKAALVDPATGELLATAEHPTTLDTDVLDGWLACREALSATEPAAAEAEVIACSSAGGGLRIAVVGNERLVTAEAGRRVALSSGGRVVHVSAGALDAGGVHAIAQARPDVLLLVGGTDGGNREVLLGCAEALAGVPWPVVVAGNVDAAADVGRLLERAGTPFVLAGNVVPRIGVLAPGSARRSIREMFLAHVIGGKHLSDDPAFARMVRGATPDVVLRAVELLARGIPEEGLEGAGDVAVVDVGGATTDVYSVVEPVEGAVDEAGLGQEVVAPSSANRTVEGDLGMRWSAVSTVQAAETAGLLADPGELDTLRRAAEERQATPAYLPRGESDATLDRSLASCAIGLALRRHAGRGKVEQRGADLRAVGLLIGSGGALRHDADGAARMLQDLGGEGAWLVPEAPRVVVDRDYVLAAAGLLLERDPRAAYRLLAPLR